MPEMTAADRQNAVLDSARKLYKDGKFKAALAAFREALLRCPCTRDVLLQSKKMGLSLKEIQISHCHCKDFASLLTSNPPKLAMYTLAKRPCTCGSDVFHCNVPSHLNALDGMIAAYEKLEAPAKARQYATLFIITSPRAPEGYLRLAKALRLCDSEKSPNTIARCRWIYRQAIQSVQAYGNKDHPKLRALTGLLRMDIVSSMPAELQTMILQYLGNPDLCRSMRVSKTWKRACLDPSLWRNLTFVSGRRSLRKGVFNNVISKRAQGKVKSLFLCDMSTLGIDLPVFKATLKLLNQLESFSVRGVSSLEGLGLQLGWQSAPPLDPWASVLFKEAPPCLKTLDIGGFCPITVHNTWSPPSVIPMAQSLEELRLNDLTDGSAITALLYSTVWPKLRKLTMTPFPAGVFRQFGFVKVELVKLSQAAPSLKNLCIHELDPFHHDSTPLWESLERLELTLHRQVRPIAGATTVGTVLAGGTPILLSLPRLCPTIRSLEFPDRALAMLRAYESIALAYPLIAPINHTLPPVTELERLEHLYLRDLDFQSPRDAVENLAALSWFMELVKPSMSNGSLTSLAITFSPDMQFACDKVLNKAAIRTLSCFDFIDEEYGSRCGSTFTTWVRGFTNLTTLGVFPQRTENCWMHVVKVLSTESRIETIYTDVLTGVWRDEALRKAEERGIKIIEASRIVEPVLQPLKP